MPEPTDDDPFAAATVAAIVTHMNDDHAEDGLRICRWLGGVPDAVRVTLLGIDPAGARFRAVAADGTATDAVVPWDVVPSTRRQVREEFVRMTRAAEAAAQP
jgi:putative heme iron utilization protein